VAYREARGNVAVRKPTSASGLGPEQIAILSNQAIVDCKKEGFESVRSQLRWLADEVIVGAFSTRLSTA
jgi:hypothetical protein